MNLPAYSALQLPAAPVILGVRLLPFAVGHAFALARLGSPFAAPFTGAKLLGPPGMGDLLLALEVCRHAPFQLPTPLRLRWLHWTHRRLPETRRLDACIAFAKHVREATQMPPVWEEENAKDSGVHWLISVKLGLMARLGMTEAQANRTPLALALADLTCWGACQGNLELVSAAQNTALDRARTSPAPAHEGQL